MKTEYIDSEIERMTAYEKTNDLSNYGQKILNELRNVKKQLTLTDVRRSDCEIEEIVEQNKDYVLGFYTGNELKEYLSNNYA
jgi:hypothetical protein